MSFWAPGFWEAGFWSQGFWVGDDPPTGFVAAQVKVWDGSQWVNVQLRVWSGSSWTIAPVWVYVV